MVLDGSNGSGKSSLLKLVAGEALEHIGTITMGSGLVISYVPQDTSHLQGTLSDFAEKKPDRGSFIQSNPAETGF